MSPRGGATLGRLAGGEFWALLLALVFSLHALPLGAMPIPDEGKRVSHGGGSFGPLSSLAITLYPTLSPTVTTERNSLREQRQREQLDYLRENQARVSAQMAAGRGEPLAALAELLGCPWSFRDELYDLAQAYYETLLPSPETPPATLLANLKSLMGQKEALRENCEWM